MPILGRMKGYMQNVRTKTDTFGLALLFVLLFAIAVALVQCEQAQPQEPDLTLCPLCGK